MISRVLGRSGRHWVRWTAAFWGVATICQAASGRAADDAATPTAESEKMSDKWSRIVPVSDPPDPTFGEWRVWAQKGWLLAERRTCDEVEWKVVLARLVGDELPKIDVERPQQRARAVRKLNGKAEALPGPAGPMPGAMRLSYRDGRYFIRDEFGSLRCLRELKTDERPWPELELPPRDAQAKVGRMVAPQLGPIVGDSWIVDHAGPQRGLQNISADCLLRLTHQDVQEPGGIKFNYRPGVRRLTCGNWFVVDDGALLVAERLESHQLPPFAPLTAPLLSYHEAYGKKELQIIGVHAACPHDQLEKLIAEKQIKFPVVIDDEGQTAARYKMGFQASFLIDRQGKVVAGYKDLLVPPAEIEKLLNANRDAANGK